MNSWTQTFFSASLAIRSEILGSSAELTKKLSILELTRVIISHYIHEEYLQHLSSLKMLQ